MSEDEKASYNTLTSPSWGLCKGVVTNVVHEVVLRILDPPILGNGVVEVFYDLVCVVRRNG